MGVEEGEWVGTRHPDSMKSMRRSAPAATCQEAESGPVRTRGKVKGRPSVSRLRTGVTARMEEVWGGKWDTVEGQELLQT